MTTTGRLAVAAAMIVVVVQSALAANGTANYFDIDDSLSGFGLPSGSYNENGNYWSTDPAGTSAGAALPGGAQMTFGYSGTAGITGTTFTISMNGANWCGLLMNVPCSVTLVGTVNAYLNPTYQTWTVPAGATLTESISWNGGGLNFNNSTITLQGDGTINFTTGIGYNSFYTITEDGTGMVVNLSGPAAGNQGSDKQAGYILNKGTLNFASAVSSNAFNHMRSADNARFSINGGTVNNTSGSAITLDLYQGIYSIGGNFTFTGSSPLDFGTNAVVLTNNPTITVSSNTLTIGGTISGISGLSKAGGGTLLLSASNTYSGSTTISGGTLKLSGTGSINTSTNITFMPGGVLDVTNQATYVMVPDNVYTFGLNSLSSGQIKAETLDISNARVLFSGTTSNTVYVLAYYTTLSGGRFAYTSGLPPQFSIDYNYRGLKQIALRPPATGTVVGIR